MQTVFEFNDSVLRAVNDKMNNISLYFITNASVTIIMVLSVICDQISHCYCSVCHLNTRLCPAVFT